MCKYLLVESRPYCESTMRYVSFDCFFDFAVQLFYTVTYRIVDTQIHIVPISYIACKVFPLRPNV